MTWDSDDLISTRQAAELHDVDPATIRSWANRGLLVAAHKIGGYSFYRVEDVDIAELEARRRDHSGRSKRRLT